MKRNILTMCLALASTALMAQQYQVTGATPEGAKKVYMKYLEDGTTDSLVVTDKGKFTLIADAAKSLFAKVYTDNGKDAFVLLDGNANVDFNVGAAKGTKENDGLYAWEQRLQPTEAEIKKLITSFEEHQKNNTLTQEIQSDIMVKYDSLQKILMAEYEKCYAENMQAKFPAIYFVQTMSHMPREKVLALADQKPEFMNVKLAERAWGYVEAWRRAAVGATFTDFEMNDLEGQPRRLSEFVGKGTYVLIDFWASWCGPCRKEMPEVKALYEKYHAKGFDIVGVSFDNKEKAWKDAVQNMGLPWHHMSDLKGWQCAAAGIYGINSIPATLLVGPDGKIIANGLRAHQLAEKLAEIFGE